MGARGGVYEPFDAPVPTTVGAVVEGLSHVYEASGRVRFGFNGTEHTLTAFNGRNGGLSIPFTDFATCPLPPAGNHLPFEVVAGEQTPYERS